MQPLSKRNTRPLEWAERIFRRHEEKVKRAVLIGGPFAGRTMTFIDGELVKVEAWSRLGTWKGTYSAEGEWVGELVPHTAAKPKRKKRGKKK